MDRTPGLIIPSAYSSKEELEKDLQRRDEVAGFTTFEVSEFIDHSVKRTKIIDKEVYLDLYAPLDKGGL